ncbi:MAG: hypothetical protein Fur005_14650 [Roseiflexaceae bacterium]
MRSSKWLIAMLPIAVITLGVLIWRLLPTATPPMPANQPTPAIQQDIEQQIAKEWGVRITQIGVTADGGLIDLRYQVLDSDKAVAMLDGLNTTPHMIAIDGTEIALQNVHKHKELEVGRTYYILYRNVHGVLHAGDQVSVVVGGTLQLDRMPVR